MPQDINWTRGSAVANGPHDALCINWNLYNYCTTVREITFQKGCNRWMTLMVTEGHRTWCSSVGDESLYYFLLVAFSNNAFILHRFRDITAHNLEKSFSFDTIPVRPYLWINELLRHWNSSVSRGMTRYDTIRCSGLRELNSWWDGQLNLAHGLETKNKEKIKSKTE